MSACLCGHFEFCDVCRPDRTGDVTVPASEYKRSIPISLDLTECGFWSAPGEERAPCRSCQTCVESKDWLDGLEARR